jgi:hypothetical protein
MSAAVLTLAARNDSRKDAVTRDAEVQSGRCRILWLLVKKMLADRRENAQRVQGSSDGCLHTSMTIDAHLAPDAGGGSLHVRICGESCDCD